MKKLFILFVLILNSCSSDTNEQQLETNCYPIVARGEDLRGDYIIVKYGDFNNKRFIVDDYMQYINQSKLCEPINLIEQPL